MYTFPLPSGKHPGDISDLTSVLGIVDFPTVLLVDICDRAWIAFAGDSKVWESLEEQARRDAAEAEAQGDTDSASDGVLDRYYDCPD